MSMAMEVNTNLLVDLFHDKLDIACGTNEQQTAYFEYLVDENTTEDGKKA